MQTLSWYLPPLHHQGSSQNSGGRLGNDGAGSLADQRRKKKKNRSQYEPDRMASPASTSLSTRRNENGYVWITMTLVVDYDGRGERLCYVVLGQYISGANY